MSNTKTATKKPKRHSVVVAWIHPVEVSAYFLNSMLGMALYDAGGPRLVADFMSEVSGPNVASARNKLVQRFLESDRGEWLLFLDSDMDFDPDIIEGLLLNADPESSPIVGGLCFGTNDDRIFPTVYTMMWDPEHERAVTVRLSGEIPENVMLEVAATGAACLLIHRTVLEKMRDRNYSEVFPWFQETEWNGLPCGEDFTFCLRAGRFFGIGYPIYVFTAIRLGHHKSHLLTADKYTQQVQAAAEVAS